MDVPDLQRTEISPVSIKRTFQSVDLRADMPGDYNLGFRL